MSKVTKEAINAKITDVAFIHLPNSTVTLCSITLRNGYSVRGESACVDPAEYVESTGRDLAYKNAFDKIWQLEGYLLAEQLNKVPSPPPCEEMPAWQQRGWRRGMRCTSGWSSCKGSCGRRHTNHCPTRKRR